MNASIETTWPALLKTVISGQSLSYEEARWAMDSIMSGKAPAVSVGGFLSVLSSRGETVDEVAGFSDSLQASGRQLRIEQNALDIVGTGGDGHNTVNISTMAFMTAAAADVPVVKHGTRSASSMTGTADVLERMGVDLTLEPEHVESIFDEIGIAFVFAPAFFPAMRHVAPLRRELGVPTVFNLLGPLINPGRPSASAIGASSLIRGELIASALLRRGSQALVFSGHQGLDELSAAGTNTVWEVRKGVMHQYRIEPEELGLNRSHLEDLVGGSPEENAKILRAVLAGEHEGPILDAVLMNAAAGLVAYSDDDSAPLQDRLRSQIETLREIVSTGRPLEKLSSWAERTQNPPR